MASNGYIVLPSLGPIVDQVKPAPYTEWVPKQFMASPKRIPGVYTEYERVFMGRRPAPAVNPGDPPRTQQKPAVQTLLINLLSSALADKHVLPNLLQIRAPDDYSISPKGRILVENSFRTLYRRFEALRYSTLISTLTRGRVDYDATGLILNTDVGSVRGVDWGVPASNREQLDLIGEGDVINAPWDNPASLIMTQLETLQDQAARLGIGRIKHALCGRSIRGWIENNTQILNYFARNPMQQAAFKDQPQSYDIAGINFNFGWHNATFYNTVDPTSFATQATGTVELMPADRIIFIPEIDDSWWEWDDGMSLVPNEQYIGATPSQQDTDMLSALNRYLGGLTEVYGQYSYAIYEPEMQTMSVVMRDCFLPLLRNPLCLLLADVDF